MTMCNNGFLAGQLWELIDELAEYAGADVADEALLSMVRRLKAISDKQKGHLVVTLHAVSAL